MNKARMPVTLRLVETVKKADHADQTTTGAPIGQTTPPTPRAFRIRLGIVRLDMRLGCAQVAA